MAYAYRSSFKSKKPRNFSGGSNKHGRGQYISPERFIKVAQPVSADQEVIEHKFADFDINPLLKANLAAKGYITPTPIQDKTIPIALSGRDVIGIANTGTGKTAAFALPIVHKLMANRGAKALIVAPTRELAQQIEGEIRTIAKGSGLFGAVLIGGAAIGPQLRDLRSNPNIVIGTPGRIKDHLERGSLNLSNFNLVVLDEVDRMLDMGFVNDVRQILGQLAPAKQSFYFSATLDSRVNALINTFSNDPVTAAVKMSETSDNVHQNVVRYGGNGEKIDKLHDALIGQGNVKALVFDSTQRSVERLSNDLISRGFKADAIHGGKSQGARQRALRRFKDNEIDVLVATDVAARGIDIVDITHVINYSVPQTYQDYIHRVGRAGRAGRIGHALTFVAS